MKQFLKQLTLFSMPIFIGWGALFVRPMDKKFAYSTMQKHCRNANWLYHRMFQNKKAIDIALIGVRGPCAI